jgi:putative acetyltransferase
MQPTPGQDVALAAEREDDRTAVRELHRTAFGSDGEVVAELVDRLRATSAPDRTVSLVARSGGAVIGHVMLTPALLDAPRRLVAVHVLSPLAVDPAHQRRRLGGLLVTAVVEAAGALATPLVFLEGSPHYYSRFGFRPATDAGFRRPSLRIPPAAFQVLPQRSWEPWMTGTLVYPQVFWDLDCVGLRDPHA